MRHTDPELFRPAGQAPDAQSKDHITDREAELLDNAFTRNYEDFEKTYVRLGGNSITYKQAMAKGGFVELDGINPRRDTQALRSLCLTMADLLTERDNAWAEKGYPAPK